MINFENNTDFEIEKMYKEIENVVLETLKDEEVLETPEVSIYFISNEEIRQLNNEYRGKDKETDVLSFPINDFNEEVFLNEEDNLELGDIIISVHKAKEQSEKYNHSLKREVCFLVAHSMLHLLGYDHMTEDEESQMIKKQNDILERLGILR